MAMKRCFKPLPCPPAAWGRRWSSSLESLQLKQRIEELTALVAAKDVTIKQLVDQLSEFRAVQKDVGGTVQVCDGKALREAICSGVPRIGLRKGTTYELDGRIEACHGQVHLVGEDAAEIVGRWRLRDGVHFTATNVTFTGALDYPTLEVIGAQTKVSLLHCCIQQGREGIMLSSGATCNATTCVIKDNIRGVFESFRCAFKGTRCTFENNVFHMILLSKPRHKERVDEVVAAGHQFCGRQTKGDLVLAYNPVTDTYEDVFKDGRITVLTPHEATTNLVEPSW